MLGKTLVSVLLVLLLLIPFYLFIGSIDMKTHLVFFTLSTSSSSSSSSPRKPLSPCKPLRVFMYDLPARFNIAMVNRKIPGDSLVSARNFPPWPANSGLKRQHSVEYWMMASLVYQGAYEEEWREAVRVLDPDQAQAFFVPFFSSLSFNTHGHLMTDPETEIDHKLQIDLLEFLQKSQYWQRSGGRDHVIPMTHPNAFRFLRDQVNTSILIIADFGRYPKTLSRLSKDVVSPYVHVVDSFMDDNDPDPFESRKTLLFFRGSTVRKDEGIVRAKLAKILSGIVDVHYERSVATTESIKASTRGMRSSKFCLHPAGDTPSSCRLFDAIVSHCVPVIVSDKIELPFEDELDYSQFSLFFSVEEAVKPGYMVEQLREFPKERWLEMWRKLKNISHHYEFDYPPMKEDAVNMLWRQIRQRLPTAKLSENRNRRLKIPDWWDRRR